MRKVLAVATCAALLLGSVGCGTILYPERKGQISGRIDPSVAILNGVGLILFLVPGVIAFAVDFSNGSIYLPPGGKHASVNTRLDDMVRVQVGNAALSEAAIREILEQHLGEPVRLEHAEAYPAIALPESTAGTDPNARRQPG